MKTPCAVVMILALVGCAPPYVEPSPSLDHPANPTAAEANQPGHSTTLDLAAAEPIAPVPVAPGMEHAGHEMEAHQASPEQHGDDHAGHDHSAPASAPNEGGNLYVCPMHPEVTADKPDARCPKCGMKLVKKPTVEGGQ